MWNFDKIQLGGQEEHQPNRCGLMWNFDKIQPGSLLEVESGGCGLMWNFDKIQRNNNTFATAIVVV